jgi:prolyl 3-hydroxylase /prolyl 3,4-dihydroxylase
MVAVQPGKSFHDVEEVYTSEHPRLAISGWFHVPQEGEPGYSELDSSVEDKALSSLEQLTSIAEDKMWSFNPVPETTDTDFNEEDLEFLSKWINEVYLTPDVVEQLHESMTEESLLEIPDFLNADVAKSLHQYLSTQDQSPTSEGWQVAGPPHKQRFRYTHNAIHPTLNILELFQHPAFHKWLHHVTDLEVISQRSIARHFRPGSDYTLATEHTATTPQLEATLCLTPSALKPKPKKATGISAKAVLSAKETGWTTGEFGGYEVYLAPSNDEEADPAVYKASEGDDGVLVSTDAAWNVFSLVLRDTGVLKFVKYVSRAAWGGRWDVTSEWSVKYDDDDDDEQASEERVADPAEDETMLEEEEEWTGIPS